jgi:hypothetical protein
LILLVIPPPSSSFACQVSTGTRLPPYAHSVGPLFALCFGAFTGTGRAADILRTTDRFPDT